MIDKKQLQFAIDTLADYLKDGPKQYDTVKDYCKSLGIRRGILKQARQALNVKTVNTGTTWLWHLPGETTCVNQK